MMLRPCVEIDPTKFVIVVGPQFTIGVLKELASCTSPAYNLREPVFAFGSIVDEGLNLLLQTESFRSESDKAKFETLYRNAYELDPLFALRKVAASLKKSGRYEEWLNRLFSCDSSHSALQNSTNVQHLLELQRHGALLVYTHCDDILDRAVNQQPVLLENKDLTAKWSKGEVPGFLHIHGVYSKPGTVKLDCDLYETAHQPLADLKGLFREKHAIVIGFDAPSSDPLQSKFLENFVDDSSNQHAFFVSLGELSLAATPCLPLDLSLTSTSPDAVALSNTIATVTESSWSVWRQIEFPVDGLGNSQMLGLLVIGRNGATEISRMMFQAPGVNFALVNSVYYGNHYIYTVSVRLESTKLQEFWQWVFVMEKDSLLARGLLALVMRSGTFIWLRGKPAGGGKVESTILVSSENSSPVQMLPPDDNEVPMETETTTPSETNSSVKVILSQKVPVKPSTPFVMQELSSIPKGKKVPRYVVRKFRLRTPGHNGVSSLLQQKAALQRFADDSGQLGPAGIPKSVLARRCSLPPMKPDELLTKVEGNTLSQLAENLRSKTTNDERPSYAAIKQALLSDRYKRRQSMQLDPKTLKNLLQSKLMISEDKGKQDIVSQRRNSDPGSGTKQRDFQRRRELFVEENASWSESYSSVIEDRIRRWRQQRYEWRQRELLYRKVKLANQSATHILNPLSTTPQGLISLQAGLKTTNPIATTTAAPPQATVLPPTTAYLGGVNPFLLPQTLLPPTTATVGNPSMYYSPFLTPYTFVNPYSTLQLQTAQPATYYVPQTTLANQQKLFYFVQSGATTANTTNTGAPIPTTMASLSQLASLIAPTSISARTAAAATQMIERKEVQKRHHSLPEKLSSMLRSTSDESDPESPPSSKKQRSISDTPVFHSPHRTAHTRGSLTALESHLLQAQPKGQDGTSRREQSPDEKEVEDIIGGAPRSPEKDLPVPAPRSQLQLWQFLLELLLISANSHLIQWTDYDFEFQINKPSEIAQLWGKCTNNPTMNYEKLSRGLRYYYNKGIISKVPGKKLTFKYEGNVRNYVHMRRSQMHTEEFVVVE